MCLLNDEGYRAIEGSSRPPLINLTVPTGSDSAPWSLVAAASPRACVARVRLQERRLLDRRAECHCSLPLQLLVYAFYVALELDDFHPAVVLGNKY